MGVGEAVTLVGEDAAGEVLAASPDTGAGPAVVPPQAVAVPAHPLLGVASGGRDPNRLAVMVGAETSRPGRAVSPAGSAALERGRGPGPETSAAITVPTAASTLTATSASASLVLGFV